MSDLRERTVTFRITGYTPLLMHNPVKMSSGASAKTRRVPSPEEEAEAGLYSSEEGRLYVKFIAIRACAIAGAKALKVGRMGAAKFLAGCLMNVDMDEPCWLFHPRSGNPLTRNDYVIDVRRVVVQGRGVIRARPKLMEWATDVKFLVDTSQLSKAEEIDALLLDALSRGGQFVGIGDYRPERNGPFGRFNVELLNGKSK